MKTKFTVRSMSPEDRIPVTDIFNYYIENSFAAYPENKVGYEFYDMLLNMSKGYPTAALISEQGELAGFGFLRPYSPMPAFRRTAEISYFISPEYIGKGLGALLLEKLTAEVAAMNIDSILASISSLNEISISFHKKHGFTECGRFVRVGKKKNADFDIVWMQRNI